MRAIADRRRYPSRTKLARIRSITSSAGVMPKDRRSRYAEHQLREKADWIRYQEHDSGTD
jgi:hypothetical protein